MALTPDMQKAIAAWKLLRLADVLDVADNAAKVIQQIAIDGTIGARPVVEMVGDIAAALELSQKQARTVYDTAVSTFSRTLVLATSNGTPDELFLYVGPTDQKVRPFCRQWIGRVVSRKVIDALDNGQLPNVFLTGGGYNCRHVFKRVGVFDFELIEIADTFLRAPGIALKKAA